MLRFRVLSGGKLAKDVDLSGAYLVGSDGVPVRAEIEFKDGCIECAKRVAGPVGLAILWPVPGVGKLMLETTRLQERDKPYLLQLELARNRLMRLAHKQEDWELEGPHAVPNVGGRVAEARDLLIKAMQTDEDHEAARLAEKCLAVALHLGEDLALEHAGAALARKRQENGFSRRLFGCWVDQLSCSEAHRKRIASAFDFVAVPFCWRQIEPTQDKLDWKPLDTLVETLARSRIPIKGSGLVNFAEENVPDWLYIWEHDFEKIRDLVYENIRRVINRYHRYIQVWDVVSGIHGINCISFNFEQLMELTRMAASVTKQLQPKSLTIIDLVAPWGEYYARNQRTIPPMLYADMAVQSGINFDAFGLQVYFGLGLDGMYVRDLFQVSSMLDRFSNRGKPLHVTGVQVPSATETDRNDAWKGAVSVGDGGKWWDDWNEELQSRWLANFYEIALSKPMVDTVTWRHLADAGSHYLPHGGLLGRDLKPKLAFKRLQALRKAITAGAD